MPKGTPLTETQRGEILRDAAVIGIKEAAKLHDVSISAVYNITYDYPDIWEKVKAKVRPAVELNAHDLLALASNELLKRLRKPEECAKFKPGELVSIFKGAMSSYERFARIDTLKADIADFIKELRAGHREALETFKYAITKLSEEEIKDILDHCTGKPDNEAPGT